MPCACDFRLAEPDPFRRPIWSHLDSIGGSVPCSCSKMSPPQHAPAREFLTGSLLFFLGTLSPALNEWIKLAFDQQDNRSKLEDAERDYVLRVVELQSKATPGEAQAIAALTTVATRAYLRREDMRRNFANALAEYAVRISGNQAATQAPADLGDGSGVPQTSTAVAAAMGQVSAASLISDATNRASAPTPQAARTVLQAGSARVFFQIARDGDRAAVAGVGGCRRRLHARGRARRSLPWANRASLLL